eukprot:8723422-Heterocapsa_arctica.AAC.1
MALVNMPSLETIMIPLERYCGRYLAACSCLTWQWYPILPKPSVAVLRQTLFCLYKFPDTFQNQERRPDGSTNLQDVVDDLSP